MIEVFTVSEIAEKLKVSPSKVRLMVRAGELKSIRFGRCLRIRLADAEAFVNPPAAVPSGGKRGANAA